MLGGTLRDQRGGSLIGHLVGITVAAVALLGLSGVSVGAINSLATKNANQQRSAQLHETLLSLNGDKTLTTTPRSITVGTGHDAFTATAWLSESYGTASVSGVTQQWRLPGATPQAPCNTVADLANRECLVDTVAFGAAGGEIRTKTWPGSGPALASGPGGTPQTLSGVLWTGTPILPTTTFANYVVRIKTTTTTKLTTTVLGGGETSTTVLPANTDAYYYGSFPGPAKDRKYPDSYTGLQLSLSSSATVSDFYIYEGLK